MRKAIKGLVINLIMKEKLMKSRPQLHKNCYISKMNIIDL